MNGDDGDEPTITGDLELLGAALQRGRAPRLEQVEGPGAPRTLLLDRDEMVLGRSRDADLTVDGTRLSRRHVAFHRRGGEVRCRDLESSNGTRLNGVPIHAATLHDGDRIQLGDVLLVFRAGG